MVGFAPSAETFLALYKDRPHPEQHGTDYAMIKAKYIKLYYPKMGQNNSPRHIYAAGNMTIYPISYSYGISLAFFEDG
jgi:hypothetical protein